MADNSIVQTIKDAEIDARSLSEFISKDAKFMVTRRLAPTVHTLSYYLERFDALKDFDIEKLVTDALDATVVGDGGVSSSLVVTSATETGSVKRSLDSVLKERMTAVDFGVVGDGVANDTDNLKAYHEYCNRNDVPADYVGLKKLLINANAEIPIKTDVNFRGVPIRIANRNIGESGWNVRPATTFMVFDESTPLVEKTNVSLNPDAQKNIRISHSFLKGEVEGSGYAKVEFVNSKIPPRNKSGELLNYTQSFNYIDGGTTNTPPSAEVDISDFNVFYRQNTNKGKLELKNINIVQDNNFQRLIFLSIKRNQVTVDRFIVTVEEEPVIMTTNVFMAVADCSEFHLRGYSGPAIKGVDSAYILDMNGVSNALIEDVFASGGWGWIGANYLNNITFRNCKMNRLDVHASGHNILVENCTLIGQGILIGWAGGYLTVRDSKFVYCPVLEGRADYCLGWGFNEVAIYNCTMFRSTYPVISIPVEDNSFDFEKIKDVVPLPSVENVIIDGLFLKHDSKGTAAEVRLFKNSKPQNLRAISTKSVTIKNVIADDTVNVNLEIYANSYRDELIAKDTLGDRINDFMHPTNEVVVYTVDNVIANRLNITAPGQPLYRASNLKLNVSNIKAAEVFVVFSNHVRNAYFYNVEKITYIKTPDSIVYDRIDNMNYYSSTHLRFENCVIDYTKYNSESGDYRQIGVAADSKSGSLLYLNKHGNQFIYCSIYGRGELASGTFLIQGTTFDSRARINQAIMGSLTPEQQKKIAFTGFLKGVTDVSGTA